MNTARGLASPSVDMPAGVPAGMPSGILRGVNDYGPVYFKDEFFPLDHCHGDVPLVGALELTGELLARLGDGLTQADVLQAAFLDIETTGLSGEMGQYAFLVGIGTFDNLAFRVRQFFLTDRGGEAAMLAAVTDTLARCRSIVTFNGKTFDIPQLTARYRLANQRAPFSLPHIDLLAPTRRLFSRQLPACRLADVETHLLGFPRDGDIAGGSIPAAYQAYIRRLSAGGLPPIFLHNSRDVLSLVALLAFMNREPSDMNHRQRLGVARWDEAAGRKEAAAGIYREVASSDRHGRDGEEAAQRLTKLLRKDKDWAGLAVLLRAELAESALPARRIRASIELARLCERTLKQPEEALAHARTALDEINRSSLHAYFAVTEPLLLAAVERLTLRLSRRTRRG